MPATMPRQLTVSIAAYNDAVTLETLIRDSVSVAGEFCDDFEVLVIDDGSRDETPALLQRLAAELPCLRVVRHPQNLGFGPTIYEAYASPESEWVLYLPGDAQIPPTQLRQLCTVTDRCHFVLGHRRLRQDPWGRRVASRFYNGLISLLAGRRIRDTNSVALVQPALLRNLNVGRHSAFVHAELLLEALRQGAEVGEVEIEHRPRQVGEASGNKVGVIAKTVRDALAYWLRKGRPVAVQSLPAPRPLRPRHAP